MSEDLDQKRRQDLEKSLRETDDLIDQYRQLQRVKNEPRELAHYRYEINRLTKLRKEYQIEYTQLRPFVASQDRAEPQQSELIDPPGAASRAVAENAGDAEQSNTAAEAVNTTSGEQPVNQDLIERITAMAEAIFDNVMEPWTCGDGIFTYEGLGIRLMRRRYNDIEESRGELKTFALLYRDGAQLENSQIRMTARFIGDIRSKFEALLHLIEQIPESAMTLSVKFDLQNDLLTTIDTARELESELISATAKGGANRRPPFSAVGIAGKIDRLFRQTYIVLVGTCKIIDCL